VGHSRRLIIVVVAVALDDAVTVDVVGLEDVDAVGVTDRDGVLTFDVLTVSVDLLSLSSAALLVVFSTRAEAVATVGVLVLAGVVVVEAVVVAEVVLIPAVVHVDEDSDSTSALLTNLKLLKMDRRGDNSALGGFSQSSAGGVPDTVVTVELVDVDVSVTVVVVVVVDGCEGFVVVGVVVDDEVVVVLFVVVSLATVIQVTRAGSAAASVVQPPAFSWAKISSVVQAPAFRWRKMSSEFSSPPTFRRVKKSSGFCRFCREKTKD
jgi:hypothetical protein